MKKQLGSRGKRVIRKVRRAAHRAKATVIAKTPLPPPPSELRLTPGQSMLLPLQAEAARLREEIALQVIPAQDHPTTGNHLADDASDVFEQLKDLALKENLERMLEQVEAALHTIEEGTYGICARCGAPIGIERLQAIPYALTCVICARANSHGS